MLLLRSPCQPTAHTMNVYCDPGVKPVTVIVVVLFDADREWPTSSYLVADCAGCVKLNVRDRVVELTNSHSPSRRGAE